MDIAAAAPVATKTPAVGGSSSTPAPEGSISADRLSELFGRGSGRLQRLGTRLGLAPNVAMGYVASVGGLIDAYQRTGRTITESTVKGWFAQARAAMKQQAAAA